MKAAFIRECGPPENIIYGDLPDPEPTETQVLVKVSAVAVNPVDTYIRNGANYWDLPNPFIIGCDVAGTVTAVGKNTHKFKVGDRVWGTNQGLMGRQGTFAEYCAIDECWLYPTPDGVQDETAAACALVGVTAQLGLGKQNARLQPRERVFVNGGTGGVGSMVIQMAKRIGADVIATAGSDEKCELGRQLGADRMVNYNTEDVAAAVNEFAPNGVNVIWETQREPDFLTLVEYMAERGRIVLMAGRDARPVFPVGPFYVKCGQLCGFVMFKCSARELENSAMLINRWLAEDRLKPCIGKVMPLAEAAEAHRLQEQNTLEKAGTLTGKIVLQP